MKSYPRTPKSRNIKGSSRYENLILTAMATTLTIHTMKVVAYLMKNLALYDSITTEIIQQKKVEKERQGRKHCQ